MTKNHYHRILFLLIIIFTSCSSDKTSEKDLGTVYTQNMNFKIDENPNKNQSIGTIIAYTTQGNAEFSIIEQNPINSFTINTSTGELYVDKILNYDYEANTQITGSIKVSNGNISKISYITISITDLDETTFNGDVTLTTQEEINTFAKNNYKKITGSLQIGQNIYSNSITNLNSLATLETIGGSLNITNNNSLLNLAGLNNLVSTNKLVIYSNKNLADIDGLSKLTSTNSIFINDNDKLLNIDSLSKITILTNFLSINNNELLKNIDGLKNIISVGTLESDGIRIQGNSSLINIGLLSLNNIKGGLYVDGNSSLTSFKGLDKLTKIENSLLIIGNANLIHFDELANVNLISGKIIINNNPKLNSLNGFLNLTSITQTTSMQFTYNSVLSNFCGIKTFLKLGFEGGYVVVYNAYDPKQQDIYNGFCSQ